MAERNGTGPKPRPRKKEKSPVAPEAAPESTQRLPLVVGIGASAGGLDAFKTFFAGMPSDCGMAFVLVQHLDPHHKSILAELIAWQTSMPVSEAEDGMRLSANAVYVIPADATLTINGDRLRLERPAPPRQSRYPIDSLFVSLAESRGPNTVGIVLAGTGRDGTLGIRAIKTSGGLTLAQAGFDSQALSGMPESAAATGQVDQVMSVESMPARLIAYERHLRGIAPLKDESGVHRGMDDHLATIAALLHGPTGHDFAQYKHSTLGRRIQRRMQVLQIESVPEFVEMLRQDRTQLELLFREFLIGVTRFFRDEDAFEALRTNGLPSLFDAKRGQNSLRVWVPACATGEEVYSIAILLKEEMERRGVVYHVQIFGTDIDDSAVSFARSAKYPKLSSGLSPGRIERWFTPLGDGYTPIKQIREMCVFSVHSLTRDPPFSRLDLISCRNLLIYLEGELQERVVCTFNYALKPGGILFLGPSEGLNRGSKLFALLDERHRLFQRRNAEPAVRLEEFAGPKIEAGPVAQMPEFIAAEGRDDLVERQAREILDKFAPAYLVIDHRYDVVRFSGEAIGRYIAPSGGVPRLNLFALLRKNLRPTVRVAAQEIFSRRLSTFREQIAVKLEGESRLVTIIAEPLIDNANQALLCLVAFQDLGPIAGPKRSGLANGTVDATIDTLEQELQLAKAQLLAAVAGLETANNEAASSAEEYQSVNEELQSSNEELETAKEEMQSINEELQTVNAELNNKNDELTRSNSDLQNLLDSTEIATIFLDDTLCVRGYTPAMTELFPLRESDRGRPLDEVVSRLAYGELRQDVRQVSVSLATFEREVEIKGGGNIFLMRIRPYRTLSRAVDGTVITFVDISAQKKIEEVLREHAAIVEFSNDALISVGLDNIVLSWNPGAERLFGYGALDAIGRPIAQLAGATWLANQGTLLDDAKAGRVSGPLAMVLLPDEQEEIDVELTAVPIRGGDGVVTALALSARDIRERKEADTHRAMLLRELSHRVKNALATVGAIVTQTLGSKPTTEAFTATFSARLMALAKTHELLTQSEWQGAEILDVVDAELSPYRGEDQKFWWADGPPLRLDSKTALALGMALHELATNAAKYGAFSTPSGRVEVTWGCRTEEDGERFRLTWTEIGGPPVQKPVQRGFGTRLIGDGLAFELDGEVELKFDAGGLCCIIDAPLSPFGSKSS